MEWRFDAKCRGWDPELFSTLGKEAEAARVCTGHPNGRECPVLDLCLNDAIKWRDLETVRGGKTPEELEAEVRRRNGTTVRAK